MRVIQFPLAEHYTKISMLRDFSYKALHMMDLEREGKASRTGSDKTIAMAKCFVHLANAGDR